MRDPCPGLERQQQRYGNGERPDHGDGSCALLGCLRDTPFAGCLFGIPATHGRRGIELDGGSTELVGDSVHFVGIHTGHARLAGFRIGDPLRVAFLHAIAGHGDIASLLAAHGDGERIGKVASQR